MAVVWLLTILCFAGVPSVASAAVPVDPRIEAAVAAWETEPLYVDPRYSSLLKPEDSELVSKIRAAKVPVYVAVLPTGAWFQEKGDTALLAGWLATANGKPGFYLVMDGFMTEGVKHNIAAWGPRSSYGEHDLSLTAQLEKYLSKVEIGERYASNPARTTPEPPRPERTYPEEKFTVGKAIGNGAAGLALGLPGGALLAGVVLGVAALVARRGGGRL